MSRQLLRWYGDPPRERGMSSSTSGLIGCGLQPWQSVREHLGPCCPGVYLSVLSTVLSHSAQWVSSASTRERSSRRRCPLLLSGIVMLHPLLCWFVYIERPLVRVHDARWSRDVADHITTERDEFD